jgi:hypothetical protein
MSTATDALDGFLLAWILVRRLDLNSSPLLIKQLSRDRGEHLSGLMLLQQVQIDSWVRCFADTVARSATSTVEITNKSSRVAHEMGVAPIGMRSDAVARRILTLFPERSVVIAHDVVVATGVGDGPLDQLWRRPNLAALSALTDRPRSIPTKRPNEYKVQNPIHRMSPYVT